MKRTMIITNDHIDEFDLTELAENFPNQDEFEVGSEWTWTLDSQDEDGDEYTWFVTCYFDPGDPSEVYLSLYKRYFKSGCWSKNTKDPIVGIACELEDEYYPSDFDEICWELVETLAEMIYKNE